MPRESLLAAPERLLVALMQDGWLVRNKIVWAKPNPIPSSVADRLSSSYEVIYLLVRNPRYYFALDAIRTPHTTRRTTKRPTALSGPPARRDPVRPAWRGPNADGDSGLRRLHEAGIPGHPLGKNPGDVWTHATSRYRGAHFATYPEALVTRMTRAGCPEARCRSCRAPWTRKLRRGRALGQAAVRLALRSTCTHAGEPEPGLVLDPFMGSGTTAVVAEAEQRDWLGIELNPTYVQLALDRLEVARTTHTNTTNERRNP